MTDLEHYIYITPPEYLFNIPEKYKILTQKQLLFPDFNKIIDDILNKKDSIFCEKGTYINKSIIKEIKNISYTEYKEYLIT